MFIFLAHFSEFQECGMTLNVLIGNHKGGAHKSIALWMA